MHVFNVPASAPFLRTVVAALVDGRLIDGFEARRDPSRLADVTLYLPTRRAGRLVREVFLEVLELDAVLLPRIRALGDIDEDELAFAEASAGNGAADLEIPPALGGLERRLVLAQLIAAWARTTKPANPAEAALVVGGPAAMLALADDLARLMDDMITREVPWQALAGVVPDSLDVYWQQTLQFLRIASDAWPAFLREQGRIEPAQRRDLLIDAEARRLGAHPGPVIAAGSTGSMPATAKFLDVVARLPQGAVVLPGLDVDLDADSWRLIGGIRPSGASRGLPPLHGHPQYALHGLLARLGIARDEVRELAPPALLGREILTSEVMRPAGATAEWHRRLGDPKVAERVSAAMVNLAVIAAPTSELEALAIAVAMRDAFEQQGKSVALVTPDRALARRVIASLDRWGLAVDDSGGDALVETSAGRFAWLIAAGAADGLAPPTLLALLKHPLLRLGRAEGGFAEAIEALELALLRGPRPGPGTAGLAHDLAILRTELTRLRRGEVSLLHPSDPQARLSATALDQVEDLVARLAAAFAPVEQLDGFMPHDLAVFAAWHREAVAVLSCDADDVSIAFEDADGTALAQAFDDIPEGTTGVMLARADYAEVFTTAFGDRVVRRPQRSEARLRIFGPLEARLTVSDRVILGGLVEGVWPPAPRTDPWLNRPMRHQLGLDLPERRIGLSAHDFEQLLGAPEVILSHAVKVGGAPAVASRFLHRLEAVAGEARWSDAQARGARYVAYAEALDRPAETRPISQPQPKPPRAARPLKMSVTEIEDWLRDPYTIYAKRILGLRALDPVDMPLSAADRGSAIHAAIGDFAERYAAALPDDIVGELRRIGAAHFAPLMDRPEARALWWPRFLRIAGWLSGWELGRRQGAAKVLAEIRGTMPIPLDAERTFVLSARADRIEALHDGGYAILDFKTGTPPTSKQVRVGLAPQLTLEAAILRDGGFAEIAAGVSVRELAYVRISGNNPPGEHRELDLQADPNAAADEARAKLEALIRRFEDESQGYTSLNLSMWAKRYGDYDALARIMEWSAAGDASDEVLP